jgi:hypothetical protein
LETRDSDAGRSGYRGAGISGGDTNQPKDGRPNGLTGYPAMPGILDDHIHWARRPEVDIQLGDRLDEPSRPSGAPAGIDPSGDDHGGGVGGDSIGGGDDASRSRTFGGDPGLGRLAEQWHTVEDLKVDELRIRCCPAHWPIRH